MTSDPPPSSDLARRPLVAEPVPAPAVLATPRAELARRARRAAWKRAPCYLLVAALLHAAALWYLYTLPVAAPEPEREQILRATTERPPPAAEKPPEEPPPPIEPPDLPPVEDPEVPVEIEDLSDWEVDLLPGVDVIGLGGGGGGRGGRRSGLAGGTAVPEIASLTDSGFRGFVDDLRGRGLDVVFVMDATASMQPYIDRARATIDAIIADLAAVVPDLRLGVVAFRDRSDEWLVRREELTEERYRIHNFLLSLEAIGGGDFEEAVDEGLRVAAEELDWRPTARRVLILIGDAPPHVTEESVTLAVVRGFARDRQAAVSALYTGGAPERAPSERDKSTRAFFERIARTGGGLIADLTADGHELRDQILDASLGTEWRDEIRELLARRQGDLRDRIVERKLRNRDRAWLLGVLDEDPIHPGVIEACVQLFDGGVARRAFELLSDETRPPGTRAAMLFLLKAGLGRTLHVDIDQPLADQVQALARMRREVERLAPPAPRGAPRPLPPGAPPAGGVPPPPPGSPPRG